MRGAAVKTGRVLIVAILVLATGCYHQYVDGGVTPGATVIEEPWVATWALGFVPAKPLDVGQQCRNGIALVETRHSLPNIVASVLTLGVYTPVAMRITCAATRSG